jgi:hypothetical protein
MPPEACVTEKTKLLLRQGPAFMIPQRKISADVQVPEARFSRGAAILIEALVYEGVDTIFGYPGGAVLHIYDELWRARDRITHYLVRHEQGAVHMVEGYARSSGKVGVALVTSGPGANMVLVDFHPEPAQALVDGHRRSCLTNCRSSWRRAHRARSLPAALPAGHNKLVGRCAAD